MDKREALLIAAREQFMRKGYKAANIADITKAAGLGVGTFYNYFDSKEAVFFEVYLLENQALKSRLQAAADPADDPVSFVSRLLTMNTVEMANNNILKEWYNKELFAKLEKLFAQSGELEKMQRDWDEGELSMIRHWKQTGQLRQDIADEMILAIFRALPYVDLHKDEIGAAFFPDLLCQLTALIMKGLMK